MFPRPRRPLQAFPRTAHHDTSCLTELGREESHNMDVKPSWATAIFRFLHSPKIFESCKGPVSRRAIEADPNFIPCSNMHFPNRGFFDGQSGSFFGMWFMLRHYRPTAQNRGSFQTLDGQNIRKIASRIVHSAPSQQQDEMVTQELI